MPEIDLVVATDLDRTTRVRQLEAIFDVPAKEKLSHHWKGAVPFETQDWNIGLIVGPSGAGKSSVKRQLFGEQPPLEWKAKSLIDDFDPKFSIEQIAEICQAVGFNTIPSWMKPYEVLSTGEKFRVDVARHLLDDSHDPIVIDEFTSVVDRQVAHIGCHAVQKYVRRHQRKFVGVTCHYDVVDWLQPDWVFEPATMNFQWRSLRRRPELQIEVARVDHSAWQLFAPFHYLTGELHRAAACYVLFVDGAPAAFQGILHRPHPRVNNIKGSSRGVTLPDYQGLGLIFIMVDMLGAAHAAIGNRFRTYPAHPALIRSFDRSNKWTMCKKPGDFSPALGRSSTLGHRPNNKTGHMTSGPLGGGLERQTKKWNMGHRPCAVFEYAGPPMTDAALARALIDGNAPLQA